MPFTLTQPSRTMPSASILALALCVLCASAGPTPSSTTPSPTVLLDLATVHGVSDGYTNSFLGIPYAQPPYVLALGSPSYQALSSF